MWINKSSLLTCWCPYYPYQNNGSMIYCSDPFSTSERGKLANPTSKEHPAPSNNSSHFRVVCCARTEMIWFSADHWQQIGKMAIHPTFCRQELASHASQGKTSDVAIGIALLAGVSVAVFANGAGQEAAIHPKIETRIAFQTWGAEQELFFKKHHLAAFHRRMEHGISRGFKIKAKKERKSVSCSELQNMLQNMMERTGFQPAFNPENIRKRLGRGTASTASARARPCQGRKACQGTVPGLVKVEQMTGLALLTLSISDLCLWKLSADSRQSVEFRSLESKAQCRR